MTKPEPQSKGMKQRELWFTEKMVGYISCNPSCSPGAANLAGPARASVSVGAVLLDGPGFHKPEAPAKVIP